MSELFLLGAGDLAGTLAGAPITVVYAVVHRWRIMFSPLASLLALAAALLLGALAGLYPAIRAAGLSPTDALRIA